MYKVPIKKSLILFFCLILLVAMTACQGKDSGGKESGTSYKAGTYSASADGKNGPIKVEVVFTEDAIKSVTVKENNETPELSEAPIKEITSKIVADQSLAIDAVSGATVTSKAILAAVEDAVKQAGGDANVLLAKKKQTAAKKAEEVTYDVVVVGAGAAGSAAALKASEGSDKVLLLEKTATPSGAGTLAGGMFAAESRLQKEAGKTVDKKWLYDEYMKSSSGFMNSILVSKIIDESSNTVDWLMDNGMQLNLADSGTGGSYAHIGMPTTLHGYNEGGKVAITKLIDKFKENGGTVMFSTPAKELMVDKDGKVTGVIATKEDGSKLKVNAKSVVIATGGFGGNDEMLKKVYGKTYTKGEVGQNTGAGIEMAWTAGADEYGTKTSHYFWETFKGEEAAALGEALGEDYFGLTTFTFYPHLRVNTLGQRFTDETTATNFAIHGAQIAVQPKQTEYLILDTSVLKQIAEKGYVSVEDHYGTFKDHPQSYMEFNLPNNTEELIQEENTPTDFTPLLEGALGTGVVFKGNSIEELAKNMGVDQTNLVESVNLYNQSIQTGKDPQFFADTTRLVSVTEGPFYAVKYVARNLGTLGGVKINENIEAIDKNGQPIPGLYVAGADAGGMYGGSYVDFEGGTLGFAYTSGKIAGENAASYAKKQ